MPPARRVEQRVGAQVPVPPAVVGTGQRALTARDGSFACQTCRAGFAPSTTDRGADTPTWEPATTSKLQTGCDACPALYFKTADNTTPNCDKCAPGSETRFASGAAACTQCVPGFVNPAQSASAVPLAPGTGQANYYGQAPDGALGVSTTCLPW